MRFTEMTPRQKLVQHVQELERLEEAKAAASDALKGAFERAKAEGPPVRQTGAPS